MSTGSSRMRGATPAAGDPFGFADAATEGVACRVGDSIAIGCAFEPRSVCEAMARLKTAAPAPAKPAMKRRFLLLRSGVAGAGDSARRSAGPGAGAGYFARAGRRVRPGRMGVVLDEVQFPEGNRRQ